MNLKKFGKRTKRVLAFVLAFALFFNGWANYDFSVFAAELTVALSASSAVYTGNDISLPDVSVQKDGQAVALDADGVTVKWTADQNQTINTANNTVVAAGTYTVTVSVIEYEVDENGNLSKTENGELIVKDETSKSAEFKVEKIDLASASIEGVDAEYDYAGAAITPNVSVKYNGAEISSSLYEVSYISNDKTGNATVKVSPNSAHASAVLNEKTKDFAINAIDLKNAVIEGVKDAYDYNGEKIQPEVVVKYKNKELSNQFYEVTYGENTNAGKGTVTITPNAAHVSGVINKNEKEFTINKIDFSDSSKTTIGKVNSEYDYTGSEIRPEVEVTYNGEVVDAKFYRVEYAENKVAGNAEVTIIAKEGNEANVTGSCKKAFVIKKIFLSDSRVSATVIPKLANAEKQEPDVNVVYTTAAGKTITLVKDTDYTIEVKDNAEVKEAREYTYIFKAVEDGNYIGETLVNFKVEYSTEGNIVILGNTLSDNYYSGDVTIRAEKTSDEVSTEELGGYVKHFIYKEGDVVPTTFYVKGTAVSRIDIAENTVRFDNIKPEVPTVTDAEASKEWVTERTFTVKSSDEVGLFDDTVYYTENKIADDVTVITADMINNMTAVKDSSVTFASEENNKVYYFYAVDKAGNYAVTEVEVEGIDTKAPVVELSEEENFFDDLYWKNATDLNIVFTANEGAEESGISSITLKCGEEDLSADVKADAASTDKAVTGTLTIKKAGIYTLTVVDATGENKEEITFEVKQDTGVPTLTLNAKGTNKYPATGTADVYWFKDAAVTVDVIVDDVLGTNETEKAPFTVIYSSREGFENSTAVGSNSLAEVPYNVRKAANADDYETYYYKVTDCAGNYSTGEINIGFDNSQPKVSNAFLTQIKSDEWINADEYTNNIVKFSMEIADTITGIKTIYYSYDGSEPSIVAARLLKNGTTYTFETDKTMDDANDYQWQVIAEDNLGNRSENIKFVTSDAEGNPVNLGQIDTKAPSTTAYIQFASDIVGNNDPNLGSGTKSWTSNIYDMAIDVWNKIWGKEKITFEVYVMDEMSGIDSITMSYNGKTIPADKLERQDGIEAFTADGLSLKGYTLFKGVITTDEQTLAIKNFQIDTITDIAGNNSGSVLLKSAANEEFIYLDSVAPILSVKNDSTDVNGEEIYFYNESQKITLTIDERFFNEETDKPTVTLNSREPGGEFKEFSSTDVWSKVENEAYQWQVVIELPAEPDKEIEYQISMEAYEDPSGNPLKYIDNTSINDGYISKIFVVDTLAPEIIEYRFEEATCEIPVSDGDATVIKNNKEENDLKIVFKIDDNETYYNNVSKAYLCVELFKDGVSVDGMKLDVNKLNQSHNDGTREFEYSFSYDGDVSTENEFHVEISYMDAAENKLVKNELSNTEGIYKSEKYIIDHVAPTFDISYSEAHRVVKLNSGENFVEELGDGTEKLPRSGYIAYYGNDIDVTLTFEEKYVHSVNENDPLEHFKLVIKRGTERGTEVVENPEITWAHDSNKHTAQFTIAADKEGHTTDGQYTFEVEYKDCAENDMIVQNNSNEQGNVENNYVSPMLILDTTSPEIVTSYGDGYVQSYEGVDYFDNHTNFKVVVTDRNIYAQELYDCLNKAALSDINNGSVQRPKNFITMDDDTNIVLKGINDQTLKATLKLTKDAKYTIPVAYTDLAGNIANIKVTEPEECYYKAEDYPNGYTEYAVVDTTAPEIDLSYSTTDFANYWEWGYWFDKKKIEIKCTITDATSGVQEYRCIVKDEEGKVLKDTLVNYVKTNEVPKGSITFNEWVPIPDTGDNFKGTVTVEACDMSNNDNDFTRSHIVESAAKHSETGTAMITTLTSPSRTVNGIPFYNTDVKFDLLLEDTHSGLAKWKYVGGNTLSAEEDYKSDLVVDPDKTAQPVEGAPEITYKFEKTLTLDAAGNNENDILVRAWFEDNVGYEMDVEEKYNIDITKPIITVEYDLNNPANGKYYNEVRTATVKIRERNFDAADVEFLITSTDGPKPQISSWSHSGSGDDTINTCTVTFNQDSDYTFTLKFMDMAGNVADYNRVDEFTIDMTDPVATITYDNNDYLNEYYYDAARTATIDILEHNFDPTAIEIMVTADGSSVGVPHISAWSHNGDHNIATLTFSEDAEYTFDIAGMDLALNELEDYTPDHFVVDQTAPELEIFDIEDMSANNGVVRPGIRYFDTNYDKDGTEVLMTGYNNGVVEMTGNRKLEANGLELKLDDFAYVQEMDDIYTMKAVVYDLAGNSSEDDVMFSVNRFGSVYTFDEATEALIGKEGSYYTKEAQDLVITETNVDTLMFKEITMNLNGKLKTLKEGTDFIVKASGTEATWKQYTYTIKAENFTEEGTYILTIYSEDRATNTSDNNTKGKKVEFVVDKTSPSVLISGVETDGEYRTDVQDMIIDIDDNVIVSNVKVIIDGVETIFDGTQVIDAEGKLVVGVEAKNYAQDIQVIVTDAAGNEATQEITNVRVNANAFVLFYLNKPLFFGTLGGGAGVAALLWWFLAGKKKKNKEQAQ